MPKLTLPAKLEQLENVNAFISSCLSPEYLSLKANIELVAEELLVNVFSYAYPEGTTGTAELECHQATLDDGRPAFCISVKDWGGAFNPFTEAPTPDITTGTEERAVGGLGIYLIKSITDKQTYQRIDDANLIEIYFAKP